jgi:copper chaperone CopZ
MKTFLFLLLPVLSAFGEPVTHRVTGLFSLDRETALRAAIGKMADITLVSVDFAHAEAVFLYDPPIAFKETKPEKLVEAFDQKLREASNHTLGIQPLSTTPKEQLVRLKIPVAGVDCKACALAAYEAIYKVAGVTQATASFKESLVTALIDPGQTSRAALEEALKQRNVPLIEPKK